LQLAEGADLVQDMKTCTFSWPGEKRIAGSTLLDEEERPASDQVCD
jgi:hypothetical protein